MYQFIPPTENEEWLKILGKGMVTIPKTWRDQLGIAKGDIMRAKMVGSKILLESPTSNTAPYRVYTDEEIQDFLREDTLPLALKKQAKKFLSKT